MQKSLSLFERIVFWLGIVVMVVIPLYPKYDLIHVPQTFVAVRAEDFLVAFVLLMWGFYVLLSGRLKEFLEDKVDQAILLFLFIGLVSLFTAMFVTHTVVPYLGILHFLRRVELMMLLPVFLMTVREKWQVRIALIILVIVTAIVNFYALGQQFLHFPVYMTPTTGDANVEISYVGEWTRINSTFAGHYDLAGYLVMVLSIAVAFIFYFRNILYRGLLVVLSVVSSAVLVMTASRQSFVSGIFAVILSLILAGQKKLLLLVFVLAVIALAYPSNLRDRFISTLTVNVLHSDQRYLGQFQEQQTRSKLNIPTLPGSKTIASLSAEQATPSATVSGYVAPDVVPGEPIDTTDLGVYRSFEIRLNQEWPRAIRAFEKNPFLGTGYSSIDLATDNDYLRSFGEVGLLGTLAFSLVIWQGLKEVIKNYHSKDKLIKYFSIGMVALIVSYLINAAVIDVFEASKIATLFWLLLGMNIAAGRIKTNAPT